MSCQFLAEGAVLLLSSDLLIPNAAQRRLEISCIGSCFASNDLVDCLEFSACINGLPILICGARSCIELLSWADKEVLRHVIKIKKKSREYIIFIPSKLYTNKFTKVSNKSENI